MGDDALIHDENGGMPRLLEIMRRLREPETGCPGDIEQDFGTIAPYTIEESYEVADAIERGDFDDLKDELGDLLLQVVYHARMAEEDGHFSFGDDIEFIAVIPLLKKDCLGWIMAFFERCSQELDPRWLQA